MKKRNIAGLLCALAACVPTSIAFGQSQPQGGGEGQRGRGREGGRGLLAEANTFKTDVPAHSHTLILVRPSPTSMTVSVVSNDAATGYVEWTKVASNASLEALASFGERTPERSLAAGEPAEFTLADLTPGARYAYRWRSRGAAARADAAFATDDTRTFVTPPGANAAEASNDFTFTIIADSHLDPAMTPAAYEQSLLLAIKDAPAFHVDLGDTFMTDKRGREFRNTLAQYDAQRYYLGRLCHSAPLFMVLGNHDGESGYAARGEESIAAWSYRERTERFPPPQPGEESGGMYTGRTAMKNGTAGLYYEFTWGDAQIIALDPFWFTTERARGGGGGGARGGTPDADVVNTDDNWNRTLGKEQYDWLTRTLETSKASYKFVFIHHLVGGLGRANRGGMESSVYFEWGGKNADGSDGFAKRRPGWAMPIHDLLVKHKVSAVFHGHDHLFVRAERDGLVYQCVPQPGNLRANTRSAEMYGYKSGVILGSPGYLRVKVGADKATVDFVRSGLPKGAAEEGRGSRGGRGDRDAAPEALGKVVHTYDILPAGRVPVGQKEQRP